MCQAHCVKGLHTSLSNPWISLKRTIPLVGRLGTEAKDAVQGQTAVGWYFIELVLIALLRSSLFPFSICSVPRSS